MDDIVRQAMAKWPNVPDCYGWLGLDARGEWFLRDAATQAAGIFPNAKGQRVQHANLSAFIGRNYQMDDRGCWYFQNGPQRVFVELEATPWILRVDDPGRVVTTHSGLPVLPQQCLQDERGWVYLSGAFGLGLVHSLDVPHAANALEKGLWPLLEVQSPQLPDQYGFIRSPQGLLGQLAQ